MGSSGRAPGGGSGGVAESFFTILIQKKWPKVKDLNENLPQCLRQTGSCSHDQPYVLVNGGAPDPSILDPPLP